MICLRSCRTFEERVPLLARAEAWRTSGMCWLIVLRASWLRSLFVWEDIGVIFVRKWFSWWFQAISVLVHSEPFRAPAPSHDPVQKAVQQCTAPEGYFGNPAMTRRALKPGNPGIKKIITEWGKTRVLTSKVCTLAPRNGQNYGNIEPSWSQGNLQTKVPKKKDPNVQGRYRYVDSEERVKVTSDSPSTDHKYRPQNGIRIGPEQSASRAHSLTAEKLQQGIRVVGKRQRNLTQHFWSNSASQ